MAVKNANAKTWNLSVEWNDKRYSNPADVPEQEIPIVAPTLSSPVMGATSSSVAFSVGGGYETLIPQYSTNQSTWTSQVSDLTSPFEFTGLLPEQLYYFRALPDGNPTYASNTVSGTTLAEGDYVGAGQLASDEYVPSRIPLDWANPTASPGTGSRYLWACQYFDYNVAFVPMGGCPPYRFALTGSSTTGVSITAKAPSWNPYAYLWAEISINKDQFTTGTRSFTVECVDQAGTSITRSLTVTHDNSKFLFVDAGVTTSGDGTYASPLKTIQDWYTTSSTNSTHANKICVYRTGTYTASEFSFGTDGVQSMRLDSAKPRGHIAFPGDFVTWNMGANCSTGTGGASDWYIRGIRLTGGASSTNIVRLFSMLGTCNRLMLHQIHFDSPTAGSNTSDNTSCFYSSGAGAKSKSNITMVDCEWDNLPANANGFSLFDFYACDKTAVVGGTGRGLNCSYGAWPKNRCHYVFVAGLDLYDITNTGNKLLFTENGDADTGGIVQAIYNKVAQASDGAVASRSMAHGDNGPWGTIFQDRNTAVGRVGILNGNFEADGTSTINRNVVVNNWATPIFSTQTVSNNITATRANIATIINSNGDVISSHEQYGKVGANVKEAS